jgi:hypothetical protein
VDSISKMKKLTDLLNSDSESDLDDTPAHKAVIASDKDIVKLSESNSDAVSKSGGKRKRRIIDSDSDSDGDVHLKAGATASVCATNMETNQVPDVCETVSTPLLVPLLFSNMTCGPIFSSTSAIETLETTPLENVETVELVQQVPLMKQLRERSTMCLGDLLDRSTYKRSPLKAGPIYWKEDTIIYPSDMQEDDEAASSSSPATLSTVPSSRSGSKNIPSAVNEIAGDDSIEGGSMMAEQKLTSLRVEPEFDEWMEETIIPIPPTGKSTENTASAVKRKVARKIAKKKKKEELEFLDEISAPLRAPASQELSIGTSIAPAPVPIIATAAAAAPAPVAAVITMLVPPLPRIEIRMPDDDLICTPLPGTVGANGSTAGPGSKRRTLPKSLGKVNNCEFYTNKFDLSSPTAEKEGTGSGYSLQESQESNESDDSLDVIRAALNLNSPELDAKSNKIKARKLRRLSSTCQQGRLRSLRMSLRLFYCFNVASFTLNIYPHSPTRCLQHTR